MRAPSSRRLLAGLVAVFALLVTACGGGGGAGSGAAATPDPNAILRYAFVQNVSSFDPHRSSNAWDMVNLRLVYDQLLQEDQNGEIVPMLATGYEFLDGGTVLQLTLRDDVTFHDGTRFDSAAVKANLERAKTLETSAVKGALRAIASIDTPDPTTVRLNLSSPGGNLPALFTERHGSMISPAAFDNPDLDQKPVGSGMFTMTEYVPGQVTRYAKAPNYWDPDAVKVAGVEVYVQTSSPTRLNMLTTGQVDMTYLDPSTQDQAVAAGLHVEPSQSTTIFRMTVNTAKAPFDKLEVRQAMEHAIDRRAIVDGVLFGIGAPTSQLIPPGHWAYDDKVAWDGPDYGYDPEKAKQLLARAGYPAGTEFEMLIPALDDHRAVSEAVIPMLEAVGLRAKTRVIEPATTPATFFGRQEGNAYIGASAPFVDPSTQYESNLTGQFTNPWNTTSPEFTQAWNDSLVGATRDERLPAVHRMIEDEKDLRRQFGIYAAQPPSVWTDKVIFPPGYRPAYAPVFRGVAVAAD
ncbi:ABC transporter substrate-binding protein [Pseudonocardia lutea]|uniref:ABC transporter substrate-binding protein n=1 Tax=Pseudonocardia lutea TaxID=2172015 RepID=A0ABW1I675_9PSEU